MTVFHNYTNVTSRTSNETFQFATEMEGESFTQSSCHVLLSLLMIFKTTLKS